MFNEQLLSWLVGAIGITGFFLAGRKVWWSWYVNIICQVFWVLYAIVSSTPAFFVTAAFYTAVFSYNAWKWTKGRHKVDPADSNLVTHARIELKLMGEEPEVIEWYARVIKEYASFGHSGGSTMATAPVLNELIQMNPLTPLSSNPDEWQYIGGDTWGQDGGIWQNRRNGRAFSNDSGRTYYLIDSERDEDGKFPMYKTRGYDIEAIEL